MMTGDPRTGEECVPICFRCLRKGQPNLIVSTATLVPVHKSLSKVGVLGRMLFHTQLSRQQAVILHPAVDELKHSLLPVAWPLAIDIAMGKSLSSESQFLSV